MTINEMDTTSLQSLMESVVKPLTPSTGVARRAAHTKALKLETSEDVEHLLDMQDQMRDFINQMTKCSFVTTDPEKLTESQLELVMTTLVELKNIEDLLKAWYQEARTAVFTHITTTLAENGVDEPEWAPGEALVPALGRKFTRTGGRAKLTLDHAKLAEGFGEERWNLVHTTRIIPERKEIVVDEDKLVQMVANEPALLDVFKTAVRVDSRTPQALNTGKLDVDE
jgi:hypothetical protein